MADLSSQIEQAANDPANVSVDGLSVGAKPIGDLIRADQYLAAKTAAASRRRGIRFSKLINPGALSESGSDPSFNTGGIG